MGVLKRLSIVHFFEITCVHDMQMYFMESVLPACCAITFTKWEYLIQPT